MILQIGEVLKPEAAGTLRQALAAEAGSFTSGAGSCRPACPRGQAQ